MTVPARCSIASSEPMSCSHVRAPARLTPAAETIPSPACFSSSAARAASRNQGNPGGGSAEAGPTFRGDSLLHSRRAEDMRKHRTPAHATRSVWLLARMACP